MVKKIILALLFIFTLTSCSNEVADVDINKETTFSFSLVGENDIDEVIINGDAFEKSASLSFSFTADGDPVKFIFLSSGIVKAQKEVSEYNIGEVNSYALSTEDVLIKDLSAYCIESSIYVSWKKVEGADSYIVRSSNLAEVITEENTATVEGSVGDEITVVPTFSSFFGEECKVKATDGKEDILITVVPPSLGSDISFDISSDDIKLEYGGSIGFHLDLEDGSYDSAIWVLNGEKIGSGNEINIDWDNANLNLGSREEALTLLLEIDGKQYSKTITFVC